MTLTKREIQVLRHIKKAEELPHDDAYGEVLDNLVAIDYVYYDRSKLKLTALGETYEKQSRRYLDGETQ